MAQKDRVRQNIASARCHWWLPKREHHRDHVRAASSAKDRRALVPVPEDQDLDSSQNQESGPDHRIESQELAPALAPRLGS